LNQSKYFYLQKTIIDCLPGGGGLVYCKATAKTVTNFI